MKKETLVQVISCEFCEISMNTFFYRTPLVATFQFGLLQERQFEMMNQKWNKINVKQFKSNLFLVSLSLYKPMTLSWI